jgi:hypothetical protein
MNDVPVEDREEQQLPRVQDLRIGREHPEDRPVADQLEQEFPVVDDWDPPTGFDDDRVEPIEDDEWLAEVVV